MYYYYYYFEKVEFVSKIKFVFNWVVYNFKGPIAYFDIVQGLHLNLAESIW